jgi:hypothetical protein
LFDLAVADCNRCSPDHGMALVQRASACIRQGRFTAAVDDLDHAVADGRRGQFDDAIAD